MPWSTHRAAEPLTRRPELRLRSRARCAALAALALLVAVHAPRVDGQTAKVQPDPPRDLTELSLDELANLRVTSVEKRAEPLKDTPAAVSVLTEEEIDGAGAQTVPELLRRIPGVHVAQMDGSQWGIGIRGFTNSVARSQLALADGRSLYTPLFAGTYWDVQNFFLEDIERIEVVRGPGGTLWGSNAVTGIVNVITKNARDTQGGLIVLGAGNEENGFGRARFGGSMGSRGHYRAYGMFFDRDAGFHPASSDYDGWHMLQGGARLDWSFSPHESVTAQGDVYRGRAGRRTTYALFEAPYVATVEREAALSGGNLLARWNRTPERGTAFTVQAYYDRTARHEPHFGEDRDTVDVDAQVRFPWAGGQEMLVGAGYRLSDGRTTSVPTLAFVPAAKADHLFTAFFENRTPLGPRLRLVAGTKVERNDYSGFEFQPSGRLSFTLGPRHGLWVAATRAVRTPTRFDRDLVFNVNAAPGVPAFVRLLGDPAFETERSSAFEAGYRGQFSAHLSAEVAAFHDRHPNLESFEVGASFVEAGRLIVPLRAANGSTGKVSGGEVNVDVRPSRRVLLRASYSYLNMQIDRRPDSTDVSSNAVEDGSPRHLASVSAMASLPGRVSLSAFYRWVARLPSLSVESYSELDAHLAWQATRRLKLALAGRNLLHPHHREWNSGVEVQRSVFAEATWRW